MFNPQTEITYTAIQGPTHLFTNESLNALLIDSQEANGDGLFAPVAGFEPNVFIYDEDGLGYVADVDVLTSPDLVNWIVVATASNERKSFGRNSLQFPVKGVAARIRNYVSGKITVQTYGERRK